MADRRVVETYDAGMNMLFIAVFSARSFEQGQPPLYHEREYWQLSPLL
ncbi:MAG: hypothetical protein IPO22_14710 [Anaerolineales bacterium]|nr:hypothetical protein [Anaerolineales bacterium]